MVTYSIVIPAYNEEQWLPATLEAASRAMAAQSVPGELIVVDNNSSDHTAEAAARYGARVVFESVNQISRARNAGARAASGSFLIFVDADTLLSAELLSAALDELASGSCCGGGALVAFDRPLPRLGRAVKSAWSWLAVRFGLAAGCFIFCLREGWEATGGFSEKVYAAEEALFSRRLRRWGRRRGLQFRMIREPRAVTSGRKLDWFSASRVVLTLVLLTLFPFALRSRRLCGLWYERPRSRR